MEVRQKTGLQTQKHILFSLIAFGSVLIFFAIILNTKLVDFYYENYLVHTVLLLILCLLCSYVTSFTYEIYKKSRDVRIFAIALAFFIFAVVFFFHIISAPGYLNLPLSLFDITEHYGLFLGSLFLMGVILPFSRYANFIYKHSLKIFIAVLVLIVFLFVFLSFSPTVAELLESYVNVFIILSGVFFSFLLIFLLQKYGESESSLILYLIIGVSVLINTAIVPLYYEEENLLWWYFHIILTISFSIMLFGLSQNRRKNENFEKVFVETQQNRILKKLVLFILAIATIPLVFFGYAMFNLSKKSLEDQVVQDLILVAESKEGHLLTFLESIKERAVDFAFDSSIQLKIQDIANNPSDNSLVESLSSYLKFNKLSIDHKIYGINIIDKSGKVIASTGDVEIGKDESDDDYFINTIKLEAGKAVVGRPEFSHHFAREERSIIVSTPIVGLDGENIGIIVNYLKTLELDDVLSGKQQLGLGALSGSKGRKNTLDVYLVDRDGLMVSESRFLGKEVFLKQRVDTTPVNTCRSLRTEVYGTWFNYVDDSVYGASMCLVQYGWTVVVEIGASEVLEPIVSLQDTLIFLTIVLILAVIVFVVYFSRKLVKPIKELSDVAKKITDGDLTARANISTNDEISDLADQFNSMTESLVDANKQAEIIASTIPEPFFVLDKEGNITSANQAAFNMLRYPKGELIGKSIKDILLGLNTDIDSSKIEKQNIEPAVKNKKVVHYVPSVESK